MTVARALLAGLALLLAAMVPAAAQTPPVDGEWAAVAERAEAAVEAGRASTFALEQLREELAGWRETFLDLQDVNAGRIATVRAQLAALGPPPEEGAREADVIAERRAALEEQLRRLRAPVTLAEEAHVQASGLISEIDRIIRDRQTTELGERGPSPLLPQHWVAAARNLAGVALELRAEAGQIWRSDARRQLAAERAPSVLGLLAIALVLLTRGEWWMRQAESRVRVSSPRGRDVWTFVLSLAQILLPVLGLLALTRGISLAELAGPRTGTLVETLPLAGLHVLVARWLGRRLFPEGGDPPVALPLEPETAPALRRVVAALGWVLASRVVADAVIEVGDAGPAVAATLLFPVHLAAALALWRFGRLLRRPDTAAEPATDGEGGDIPETPYRVRLLGVVGRAARAVAVVAAVLAALGYGAAVDAALHPTILTLAVVGTLLLLQRLVFDLYTLVSPSDGAGQEALAPVLIAFALALLALPPLALVWGARVADLTELWARFREGFQVGETRISPGDFVTFGVIFAVGYLLTRLVQGGLRNSVLPKTRLDIGGQNAIVAGLGYVGIFAAALLAITGAGIDLSSLALVAGALSVGIGFGLQNIVSNFVSGIILLIERPISEGDWIEVGGEMGYVRDISVRSTRIETFDRTDVIIPNADLVSGQVTNWTRGNSVGRVIVPVGVAYGTDPDRVTAVLREVAEANPMVVLKPPPAVLFRGFGGDALNFEIRAILRDVNWVLDVQSEMNHAIARRFAEEGIEIPFAQRDIWLRNPEALRPPGVAPAATTGQEDAG